MPTIATSELPPPKSWDEFEDIVWNVYTREWHDHHAERYGRSGQAQQGVDIFGQPYWLKGGYAGIQCKRYAKGTLKINHVQKEIAEAEEFRPPLREYTIATTDRRDARLQKAIRLLNEQRRAAGKFSIYVAFWEDISDHLLTSANRDLLRKHYQEHYAGLVSPPTQEELVKACQATTPRLADELRRSQTLILRDVEAELEAFYQSGTRLCVLLGPSGVGKSMIMAHQAQYLLQNGWAALLMRGKTFSLDYMSEVVTQGGLDWPTALEWRHVLVTPWGAELQNNQRGFILLLDGVDKADFEHISGELTKLSDAIRDIPGDRLKIIVSCRDLFWERFVVHLPIGSNITFTREHQPSYIPIQVIGFSDEELDRALKAISADELLVSGRAGEWADPHIESVRDILKHPSAFGIYASLRVAGYVPSVQNLTWSSLAEQYLEKALEQSALECDMRRESLRSWLVSLACLARVERQRDFCLPDKLVRRELPELRIDEIDPRQSPHAALLGNNILVESSGPGQARMIGLSFADLGSYLLSLDLERAWQDSAAHKVQTDDWIEVWLREAYEFTPLLNAILAWIDRLADNSGDPTLYSFLRALAENRWFRAEVVFRLMRPTVLITLFRLIKEAELHHFYAYREAARVIRPAANTLKEVRKRLHDHDSRARRLAAELVGIYGDTESIESLAALLEYEEEEEVREATYTALGRLGEAAVPYLVMVIGDPSQPAQRRRYYLGALRAAGLRSEQVSTALGCCLRDAQTANDDELLRSGLLAAAHLRDAAQLPFAITALSGSDWQVVHAGAKMLVEIPDESSLLALKDALATWVSREGYWNHTWVVRQLLAALVKTGLPDALRLTLDTLRQSLQGATALAPVEAVRACDELNLPEARELLLVDLVRWLSKSPPTGIAWHGVRRLGATWQPQPLDVLASAAHRLQEEGIDLGQCLIDTMIQAIQETDDHPLRDHHAQVSALRVLAKSNLPGFAAEASRLLAYASWSLDLDICDALWVVADSRAEPALLARLEHVAGEKSQTWFQRSRVVRALGTCGIQDSATAVLAYLRSEPAISLYMPEECLCPLVRRSVLDSAELVQVVRDEMASVQGRTAALMALGIVDAPRHKDLFQEIASHAQDPVLRGYAMCMLGFAGDTTLVPLVRKELRTTQHVFVAEQAAEALARLDAHETVTEIERALEHFASETQAASFIDALAYFKEPSSVPVLLETLQQNRYVHVQHAIIQALGAFWPHRQAQQIVLEQLETWYGGHFDASKQCPAIRALAHAAPELLAQQAIRLYDAGRLDRSARSELARLVPRMAKSGLNPTALIALLKCLACDSYLPVREQAAQALGQLDPVICGKLYDELSCSAEAWDRACAVYTLGFWDSDVGKIETARYAAEFVVRHAADVAYEVRIRRQALQRLVERFQSADGTTRLSAYLALKEQGDEQVVWSLYQSVPEHSLSHTFVKQLASDIQTRLQNERRKRAEEEEKLLAAPGTVRFD